MQTRLLLKARLQTSHNVKMDRVCHCQVSLQMSHPLSREYVPCVRRMSKCMSIILEDIYLSRIRDHEAHRLAQESNANKTSRWRICKSSVILSGVALGHAAASRVAPDVMASVSVPASYQSTPKTRCRRSFTSHTFHLAKPRRTHVTSIHRP